MHAIIGVYNFKNHPGPGGGPLKFFFRFWIHFTKNIFISSKNIFFPNHIFFLRTNIPLTNFYRKTNFKRGGIIFQ